MSTAPTLFTAGDLAQFRADGVARLSSADFDVIVGMAEGLLQVRDAMRQKQQAESQLARLRGYARLTPGMKDDQRRWLTQLCNAEAAIATAFGGGR